MTNQLRQHGRDDVRHTAAVAADYNQLQGLTTAVTGAGLVAWALGGSLWAPMIIAVGVSISVSWYEKRYGKVRQRGTLASSVGMILLALLVLIAAFVADGLLGPTGPIFPSGTGVLTQSSPVLLLPLVAAACLTVGFRVSYRHVGVTWVHWASVGILVVSAFAPLLGLALVGASTGVVVLGVVLVAIGTVDHVRLTRAMKPVPHD